MSFSSEVKEELSHVDGHENHCMIAELAAIIGLCGKIKCEDGRYSLILHTENVSVARRFYSLIKDVFHFQPQGLHRYKPLYRSDCIHTAFGIFPIP